MLRAISRALSVVRTEALDLARDEKGSIVTVLVAIPVLVGTVAIGVETGQLYRTKRQMQSAADAAAVAGSIDRIAGKTGDVITSTARFEAQRNGFTDGVNNVAVTVNAPPTSGSNVSTSGAVEVIITKTQSFSLGAVINNWMGVTNNGFTIRARSVAAASTNFEACIVALTTAAEQGISITSFNNLNMDCSIVSNGSATSSNSSASIYMAGFNTASLGTNGKIWTRGSFYQTSYNSSSLGSNAQTNQSGYITDPYATSVPTPSLSASCNHNGYSASSASSVTLYPGVYCGGMSISSVSNVYFTKGTYYVANGDLYLTSVNNVSCSDCTGGHGVTIVLTQNSGNNVDIGGASITSENNVTLTAPNATVVAANPTMYPFGAGLLFYQDRRVAAGTMSSTSKIFTLSSLNNARLQGTIYFPNNRIDISNLNNSGTSTDGCTVWVGRYIKLSSYNNNFAAACESLGATLVGVPSKAKVYE